MTTGELKVLSIIWDWGGEASVDIIARATGISCDYARLLCQSLKREDYIDFTRFKLCKIKSKGRVAVAGQKGQNPRKIIVPLGKNGLGLGKNKKGRLILTYG